MLQIGSSKQIICAIKGSGWNEWWLNVHCALHNIKWTYLQICICMDGRTVVLSLSSLLLPLILFQLFCSPINCHSSFFCTLFQVLPLLKLKLVQRSDLLWLPAHLSFNFSMNLCAFKSFFHSFYANLFIAFQPNKLFCLLFLCAILNCLQNPSPSFFERLFPFI